VTAALHQRLGVTQAQVQQVDLLQGTALPEANTLFDQAFARAQTDANEAQVLLAAALLSQARQTAEGRLSAALSLLAKLVANADPMYTLGPTGAEFREHSMPNGWRYTAQSWQRLRYAWREPRGLKDILGVDPNDPIADALDEITRLSPAEPEPVSVAIQEQFPPPRIGFAITIVGLGISFWGISRTWSREKELEREVRRAKRTKR
jgi:hypothetical protein